MFGYIVQAGCSLLSSSCPSVWASRETWVTDIGHHVWFVCIFFICWRPLVKSFPVHSHGRQTVALLSLPPATHTTMDFLPFRVVWMCCAPKDKIYHNWKSQEQIREASVWGFFLFLEGLPYRKPVGKLCIAQWQWVSDYSQDLITVNRQRKILDCKYLETWFSQKPCWHLWKTLSLRTVGRMPVFLIYRTLSYKCICLK